MKKAERIKAYADCDRAKDKVADPITGRFDLRDVQAYVARQMKRRFVGVSADEFIKLRKEDRAAKLAAALEEREDTLDDYIDDASKNLVRVWDSARRINLEKGCLLRDSIIPLDEANIRITAGRAGAAEVTIFFNLIGDQARKQQLAAERVQSRLNEILGGFRKHPSAPTMEEMFSAMGWTFDGPESKAA